MYIVTCSSTLHWVYEWLNLFGCSLVCKIVNVEPTEKAKRYSSFYLKDYQQDTYDSDKWSEESFCKKCAKNE